MGMIKSLSMPYESSVREVNFSQMGLVNKLLDEILVEYSELISDIENKRAPSSVLKLEIEKKVSKEKGIFDSESIKSLLFDTLYGYGSLQALVMDDDITDIDIPRFNYVLIKRKGIVEKSPLVFASEEEFERLCKLLIIRHGGIINEVDNHCRVSDKVNFLRINVSIPPRNAYGASMNIRKHKPFAYSFEALVELDFLDETSKRWLDIINNNKSNFIICGKGASGKTTLLRTMIENGDEYERVLICESDVELYPQKPNTIVQYIKKNQLGGKVVTLSDLIKEGLTMSLDSYCIGEIVDQEAWDFIKAGYSDHRVMATLHASGSHDALDRMLLLSENETRFNPQKMMQLIGKAVQYIIYVNRFQVQEIWRVKGYDLNSHQYVMNCEYAKALTGGRDG